MANQTSFSLQSVMNRVENWSQTDQNFSKRVIGTRAICLTMGIPALAISTFSNLSSLICYKTPQLVLKKFFPVENSESFTGSDWKKAAKKTGRLALAILITACIGLVNPTRLIEWYRQNDLLPTNKDDISSNDQDLSSLNDDQSPAKAASVKESNSQNKEKNVEKSGTGNPASDKLEEESGSDNPASDKLEEESITGNRPFNELEEKSEKEEPHYATYADALKNHPEPSEDSQVTSEEEKPEWTTVPGNPPSNPEEENNEEKPSNELQEGTFNPYESLEANSK